jgi:anti-sigma factor RsiW
MMRSMVQEDPTLLIHAYLDRELDPANALGIEQRMAAEPALAAERDQVEALQRLIHERLPRESAPPGLRARIEASIDLRRPRMQPSWRALAASIAVTAVVTSGSTFLALGPQPADRVADAVVAGHIRALMAPNPIDVASSDRHTVKPWFNGRIPDAPRVVDLAGQGFILVGGRIDVVGQTPAPTLVYRYRGHIISLTAVRLPGRLQLAWVPHAVDGYNLVRWTEDGVAYWAVSDLAAPELEDFARLFRTTSADR